jgi:hypothetical protein
MFNVNSRKYIGIKTGDGDVSNCRKHMDADAVSRLLQYGEVAYINTAGELRDDFGPLSEEDKEILK